MLCITRCASLSLWCEGPMREEHMGWCGAVGWPSTHATDWLGGTINLVLIITASWLYLLFIFLYLLSCHKLFLPCPPGNVLFGLWREGLIVRCAFTNWTDETDTEKFNASTTTARCAPYSPGARVDVQLSSWRSFFFCRVCCERKANQAKPER